MGDEYGWGVANRIRGMAGDESNEQLKLARKAKRAMREEAEEAEREKRDKKRAKDEADRKKRGHSYGGGYDRQGHDRRRPPFCSMCRREGHWSSECPNPPPRQSRQG